MHVYIDNKMLAIRDASNAREVRALVAEYFDTNEAAAYVEAHVESARKRVPGATMDGALAQVLADLTRRGG
jgi:hypothetical protein